MIIWKYGNKGKLLLIFILLGVESGRNLFTAWLAAELIELMVGNGILFNSILPILIIGAIGTLIFGISKHIEAYIRTNFIKELNIRIKEILLTDTFYQKKSSISENDLSFMTNDLKLLETNGIGSEFTILQYGIQFIVALVASLIINPLLAIVYLISSAFPYTLSRIVKDSIKDSSIKWSETNNQYTNKLKDFLSGLLPIKVYEAQEEAIHLVKKSAINMEESLQKMNFIVQATNDWTMTLIDLMKTIIPYSVAAFMIMGNYLEFAEFIVVNRLAGFLVAPIVVTINSKNKIRETEPIQEKIEHANQRIVDLSLDNNVGSLHFSKSIQLKDVEVKYGSKTIFDNLSILFKKGEKVLLMAPSGFGKSTLLKLLNSTIEIDSGQFLVDNQVVNDEKEINRLFSFISQQPKLFNDSLEFNITLGRQFSEEEIMKAVEFSELKELVDDKGLSYIVGNDGNNLSGGQKQRVEIARAIINNRPIILADEMTANLDDELSNVIRQKFLASNLTLIEAAHRVTMEEMKQYDEVFKLDALS